MSDTTRYGILAFLSAIAVVSIVNRFMYPHLTETELFLKIIGF